MAKIDWKKLSRKSRQNVNLKDDEVIRILENATSEIVNKYQQYEFNTVKNLIEEDFKDLLNIVKSNYEDIQLIVDVLLASSYKKYS